MRRFFIALSLAFAPTALLAGSFDLSLDETNGERILVLARADGGVFAVAAGGADLKVLRGEEAERARARLLKVDAEDGVEDGADGKEQKKKKIILHKMDVDEDGAGAGEEEKRVVRVIRKTGGDRREETLLGEDAETLIRGDGDAEGSVERRVIRLKGVNDARAIKFIDETKGLDDGEKGEMKAAVGL